MITEAHLIQLSTINQIIGMLWGSLITCIAIFVGIKLKGGQNKEDDNQDKED